MERVAKTWSILFFLLFFCFLNSFWYSYTYIEQTLQLTLRESWPEERRTWNATLLEESWRMANLVDRHDFYFILNEERCNENSEVFLLIFVHSAPSHWDRRDAIRHTWGSANGGTQEILKIIFLLGEVSGAVDQADIEEESQRHRDIVQGNFLDSYRNLTYKHVMGLKWVAHFCRSAKFVLKADDDTFVDIFTVIALLNRRFGASLPKNLMVCSVIWKAAVKRSHRSKWFVSVRDYSKDFYPPYCSGWFIIMSMDVVLDLYIESANFTYFWIDDVVVSGILAQKIGVELASFDWLDISARKFPLRSWLRSLSRPGFGLPDVDVPSIYRLWNEALHRYSNSVTS